MQEGGVLQALGHNLWVGEGLPPLVLCSPAVVDVSLGPVPRVQLTGRATEVTAGSHRPSGPSLMLEPDFPSPRAGDHSF